MSILSQTIRDVEYLHMCLDEAREKIHSLSASLGECVTQLRERGLHGGDCGLIPDWTKTTSVPVCTCRRAAVIQRAEALLKETK